MPRRSAGAALTRVEFAPRVEDDFARILEHLLRTDASGIQGRFDSIIDACAILEQHPLIGRRVRAGFRELVIGSGSRGYLALYRHDPGRNRALVLAVRAQSEQGYHGFDE